LDKLKIAFIDLNTPIGGGHFAVANLARGLAERNHEVHFIHGLKPLNSRLKDLCSSYCHMHYIKGYRNIFDILRSINQFKKDIDYLCKTFNFDILHAQGLSGIFIPSTMIDRLVITLHGNNIYRGLSLLKYSFTNFINSYFAQYMHTILDDGFGSLVHWTLEKKACDQARKVITLSNFEANMAKKYYGLSNDKIRITPNPIILPGEESYKRDLIKNDKVVLTVGSHSLIKGTPILVKASEYLLSENDDVSHVFIGKGPFSSLVEDLSSKFQGRVKIVPSASNEIVSYYQNSSLLLHGSLYESQGLVLGEAMLAEKPVVAFNVASIPECVLDGITGYLAEPYDPMDLALKALNILEEDEKAVRMGIMGKRRAVDLYNLPRVAGKVEGIYREVLMDGDS